MATYISNPLGGALTATGTWLQTSATAENDSVATQTAATTAFQYSSTFVPANLDYSGVAIRVYSRSAANVGTVTVYFANNTSPGNREGSVTLQISDFPNLQTQNMGWAYFKFPSSVTANGTDAYKIGICTSQYVFTVSGITTTPKPGATYTNNGFTFTVQGASIVAGSGIISTSGTGAPAASGVLTKSAGTGDATINFSAATTSTGTMMFYALATTNWSRELVSFGSPASIVAGDKLLIMGALTAGNPDSLTTTVVTMDSTASTSYGPTVSGGPPDGMSVSMGGTLVWGNSASTAYQLVVKGTLAIYPGGTLNISGASNGQVSYYPFENSSANDRVGTNNGTLNGSPTFASGKIGQAVVLNGSSQSVGLPSAISTLLSISSNWSVSLWFNTTTTAGTQTIFGSAISSSNEVYLQIVSGNLTSLRYNGSVYSGFTYPVNATTWYHIALVSNGVITALYVNGTIVSTVTTTGTTNGTNATYLGCDTTGGSQWFSGMIDDVNFYKRVPSPTEISGLYTNATSLVGYWAFENNVANDLSGNGNNGTLVASPSFTTGIAGNAISLNGSSQFVTLTDTTGLKPTNITVSAWYQSAAPVSANPQIIFDHQATTPFYGYQLGVSATGQAFFSVKGTGAMATATGSTIMVANQWYHIVGTYNGTTTTVYVNGLSDGTSVANTGNIDYTVSVTPTIGCRVGGGSAFVNGQIDELQIYNTALTVSQIGALNTSNRCFPFPATSSALLQFASVANVDSGLIVYNNGILCVAGNPLIYDRCMLAADVIATATSVTTSVNTGWSSSNVWGTGDTVVLASTSTTYSQNDSRVLTGVSGTTLTVAALTNAHSGTTPYQGEIINLTRNIKIQGASQLLCGYLYAYASSNVSCQWTEFAWFGSATTNKRGFDINTTTGTFFINGCSMHDYFATVNASIAFNTAANPPSNVTATNNVIYNLSGQFINFQLSPSTTSLITFTNNWFILCTGSGSTNALLPPFATCTFNRVIGCNQNGLCVYSPSSLALDFVKLWDSNVVHSNASYGFYIQSGPSGGTITNTTCWRNSYGFCVSDAYGIVINGVNTYANTYNMSIQSMVNCLLINVTSNGGVSATSSYGIILGGLNPNTVIGNSSFGVGSANSSADVSPWARRASGIFSNCLFGSAKLIDNTNNSWLPGDTISFQKYQQIAGNHKTISGAGTLTTDSTIYYSLASGPSERMAPTLSTSNLDSSRRRTSCVNGQSITFSCYVRTSVLGDGTAYAGYTNQPQLWLIANPAAGINADVLLATASNLPGQWQLLSSASPIVNDDCVLECVLRVNGNAGWVNTALWSVA